MPMNSIEPRAPARTLETAPPVIELSTWETGRRDVDEASWLQLALQLLSRHPRLIAGFGALGLSGAIVACLVIRPLYTSSSLLHITNIPPQVTTGLQQVVLPPTFIEGWEFFQDQVQILQSRSLASAVITELDLEKDAGFTGDPGENESPGFVSRLVDLGSTWTARSLATLRGLFGSPVKDADRVSTNPEDPASRLSSHYLGLLEVIPITNTRMIHLNFTTPDPSLSYRLALEHPRQYINRSLREKFELTGEARQFLDREIARVDAELEQNEADLDAFRREHRVVSLDPADNATVERLRDLSRRTTEAEAARIGAEADWRLVKGRDSGSIPTVIDNSLIQSLKSEVNRLEIRMAELGEFFLPESPQVQEVAVQLKQALTRLDAETGRAIAGLESIFLAARSREVDLERELADQEQAVIDQKAIAGRFLKLEHAVQSNRTLYQTLLTRLRETAVVRGAQLSGATIVDPPQFPGRPSHPSIPATLGFGLLFGLATGVSLAALRERRDTTVHSADDVRETLDVPILGVVPQIPGAVDGSLPPGSKWAFLPRRRSTRPATSPELTDVVLGDSPGTEAFRDLRASILLCDPANAPRTILFTSSIAGEGKTWTALNVAASLAQVGNRVAVVDGDLRRPHCADVLGVAPTAGLHEFLRGQLEVRSALQRVELGVRGTRLRRTTRPPTCAIDVIQSGMPTLDAGNLLASERMRELIETLGRTYDNVIIDSPPIFPVSDATVLASLVDGVVLVVRGRSTARQAVRQALARLRFVRANIIGVVLNGVDPDSTEYGTYYGVGFAPANLAQP